MAIDTRIEGSPVGIRGASAWLRDLLEKRVSEAVTQIYDNRNSASGGWQGSAGEAFCGKMSTAGSKGEEFSAVILAAAESIDKYAADLMSAQDTARSIRQRVIDAGLVVHGELIESPGPGPAMPADAPEGTAATTESVAAHQSAVAASNAHAGKVAAYDIAKKESDYSKHLAKLAADTLENAWNDITQKWFIVVGDLTNGAAGTLAAKHSSILKDQAIFLKGDAAKFAKAAGTAPAGTTSSIYRDVDIGRAAASQADDIARATKNFDAGAAKWSFRAGGALAAAGVVYDIANGNPVGQAVVSGGAGFAASVGAGALIGTAIPVPVVGTAVGALGGAVVGVFASGAVDSLWQNGVGDVGGAIEDGAEAVGNTGKAIGGLAEDAWNAIF